MGDAAFEKAQFSELADDLKEDFLAFHFTNQALGDDEENDELDLSKCSAKVTMVNGQKTRLICDAESNAVSTRRVPIFLKGDGNSRIDLPEFDPTAGIPICGGGTIYIIDHVLVSKDYFLNEGGGVVSVTDAREEVSLDVNDGQDYFKQLLIATTSVVMGNNTCAGMNPQFPNIDCLGEDGVVDVSEQAGQNVTKGYIGGMESDIVPITESYYKVGLCPVNVHWHAGAEHHSSEDHDESEELTATDDSTSQDEDAVDAA